MRHGIQNKSYSKLLAVLLLKVDEPIEDVSHKVYEQIDAAHNLEYIITKLAQFDTFCFVDNYFVSVNNEKRLHVFPIPYVLVVGVQLMPSIQTVVCVQRKYLCVDIHG